MATFPYYAQIFKTFENDTFCCEEKTVANVTVNGLDD